MNCSFTVKGHYISGSDMGTSPSDLISLAFDRYGSTSTYTDIRENISLFTHYCETIIVHGQDVPFYLDMRVNPNAYDGLLYKNATIDGVTNNFDYVKSHLITMGVIDIDNNLLVTGSVWKYIYDESSTFSDLCSIAKCFNSLHVIQDLGVSCTCPFVHCEVFDNLILDFPLC